MKKNGERESDDTPNNNNGTTRYVTILFILFSIVSVLFLPFL